MGKPNTWQKRTKAEMKYQELNKKINAQLIFPE